jgi:hypothetical protein
MESTRCPLIGEMDKGNDKERVEYYSVITKG